MRTDRCGVLRGSRRRTREFLRPPTTDEDPADGVGPGLAGGVTGLFRETPPRASTSARSGTMISGD
jgi:hypothetical protein